MFEDVTNIKIAVDFDGTIVEHQYPEIGKEKLFAFEALQEMQKKGFKLILWTVRSGKRLEEAVEFCRNKGVEFYASIPCCFLHSRVLHRLKNHCLHTLHQVFPGLLSTTQRCGCSFQTIFLTVISLFCLLTIFSLVIFERSHQD